MKIIVSILFFVFAFFPAKAQHNCNKQSNILNVTNFNGESFTYVFDDSGKEITASSKYLINRSGFPILDCTFNDGDCEFPEDRFLAKNSQGKYLVLDRGYRIIIESSDSIIAFSHNNYSEDALFDKPCFPINRRGGNRIYYQAIRDGLTYLYNFNGNVITNTPYSGEIYEGSHNLESNQSYWVTVNCICDSMKMGLIDSLGRNILSQVLITQRFITQFDNHFNELWSLRSPKTNEIQLYNAKSDNVVLTYDGINSYKREYGILVYKWKNKFGIFHPLKGIVILPKYDKIETIDNTDDSYILTKGKKEKKWIVTQEIKEHYW